MLSATLAEDENRRALGYHSPRHRMAFSVGRGLLRVVLSQYLNQRPEQIVITYGRHGKPQVANSPLGFNLAHSGQLMVVAIATNKRLGIDVEQIRPMAERDAVVRQLFSPTEQVRFFQLPEEERDVAFFHLWTKKEAYFKAFGNGWAERPVAEEPGPDLCFFDWTPREGYVARIAIEGKPWGLIEMPSSCLQALID